MSFPVFFLCEAGYRIAIVLIDNTPSVAKERSMSRFMKEGRYADDSYIEAPKRTKNKRLGGLFFPTEMTCKKRWVFTEGQPRCFLNLQGFLSSQDGIIMSFLDAVDVQKRA